MFQTCVDIPSEVTLNLGKANVMDCSGSKCVFNEESQPELHSRAVLI